MGRKRNGPVPRDPDTVFSDEEKRYIGDHYREFGSDLMSREMEKVFGHRISIFHLKRYRTKHGLQSGLDGRFRKGHVSPTKGLRQEDFLSPEAIERSKATRFRKGDPPHNRLPVGTVVRKADGYLWKKVSEDKPRRRDNWTQLHRLIWEEANGPIPEGHLVIFRNGDRTDVRLENLALADNRVNGYTRTLRSDDAETFELSMLVAEVRCRTEEPQKRRRHNGKDTV